jgi:hypothetical protein
MSYGGGNPNGNYTVKLNQDQISQFNSSELAVIFLLMIFQMNVLNYNVELRPAAFGTNQDIFYLH